MLNRELSVTKDLKGHDHDVSRICCSIRSRQSIAHKNHDRSPRMPDPGHLNPQTAETQPSRLHDASGDASDWDSGEACGRLWMPICLRFKRWLPCADAWFQSSRWIAWRLTERETVVRADARVHRIALAHRHGRRFQPTARLT